MSYDLSLSLYLCVCVCVYLYILYTNVLSCFGLLIFLLTIYPKYLSCLSITSNLALNNHEYQCLHWSSACIYAVSFSGLRADHCLGSPFSTLSTCQVLTHVILSEARGNSSLDDAAPLHPWQCDWREQDVHPKPAQSRVQITGPLPRVSQTGPRAQPPPKTTLSSDTNCTFRRFQKPTSGSIIQDWRESQNLPRAVLLRCS